MIPKKILENLVQKWPNNFGEEGISRRGTQKVLLFMVRAQQLHGEGTWKRAIFGLKVEIVHMMGQIHRSSIDSLILEYSSE